MQFYIQFVAPPDTTQQSLVSLSSSAVGHYFPAQPRARPLADTLYVSESISGRLRLALGLFPAVIFLPFAAFFLLSLNFAQEFPEPPFVTQLHDQRRFWEFLREVERQQEESCEW